LTRRLAVRAAYCAYDLGLALVTWGALAPLEVARLALGRARRGALGERLARRSPVGADAPSRWLVHAVSAGEVAAAGALIAALRDRSRSASFVLTTGNAFGREAAEKLQRRLPEIEAVSYLPWDRRGALRRWLAALAPTAVVVVETEIWPNLFRTCQELRIPLFIINGRLYPGDGRRYGWARAFFADVLAATSWIGVLDAGERDAFVRIGAPLDRTEVVGNLKFDTGAHADQIPEPWRRALGSSAQRPLIVAGSTHHPEERFLINAFLCLRPSFPGLRLALAPRHTRRCPRIQRLAQRRGLQTTMWSQDAQAAAPWEVLLVDEIGPLAALFRFADVAFVGGSLVRRGGHNPLEAAAQGCPIVMGPSIEHFGDLVRGLQEAGGLVIVERPAGSSQALTVELARLLADPGVRESTGRQALAFWQAGRGVAGRYAEVLLARCAAVTGPTHEPPHEAPRGS
jgi:3-deoxy-D-manno-octulosonic-acid transferase